MSNSSKEAVSSGGVGVTGLLLVAFVVLKLTGVISWSWWWVLSPIWMPMVLALVIFIVCLIVGVLKND